MVLRIERRGEIRDRSCLVFDLTLRVREGGKNLGWYPDFGFKKLDTAGIVQ